MTTTPKRHHVVPRFFLQRFALGNQVELVDRHDRTKRITTSVEKALAYKHFYSVDTGSGRNTTVERLFATHIEGPAKRAISRIVDEKRSCSLPGLRRPLATFLAFQYVRGPGVRFATVEFFKAIGQKTALMMTPDLARRGLRQVKGIEPTDDEVDELLAFAHDPTQYSLSVTSEESLHLGWALQAALEVIPYFEQRCWQLLTFDQPILSTGDEPISLIGTSLEPGEPLGLATAPAVVFPTDPRHALVMVRPDKTRVERRDKGTPEMAQMINRHIAFCSHRFIVQHPGTDPLKGISLPGKVEPTRIQGDYVILQPKLSRKGERQIKGPWDRCS
ncbi:DUF4238 domain-containing protein [Haliangium ochraceum]|uniref:DUF4238 domain-containing protein n=1 Tax=Haliangium ochraceum (strain DSM 14365 / JCM 11303 / SMP-2) TaxID=502025 RepID=D0LS00_HALO1|nr:DUF4238 domain-containing protein [Haliangium ochraceum]ACY13697.1 hypothetical protein Hoch_1114 [Haliangium ochraceum DSM 14365]